MNAFYKLFFTLPGHKNELNYNSLLLSRVLAVSASFSSSSPRNIFLLVFEAKLADGASIALMYLLQKQEDETKDAGEPNTPY